MTDKELNEDEQLVSAFEFDGAQFALLKMLGNIDADEYYSEQLSVMTRYAQQLNTQNAVANAELVTLRAERDALQAKLDAVPVDAIKYLRSEGLDDYWVSLMYSDSCVTQNLEAVDAWLKQVQP